MPDEIFLMHRRVTVSRDSDRAGTKGVRYQTGMGSAMDARIPFNVREADEQEAKEAEQKLKADINEAIERLEKEAAIKARMAELRREGYRP